MNKKYKSYERANIMYSLVFNSEPLIEYEKDDDKVACEEAVYLHAKTLFTTKNTNPYTKQYKNLENFLCYFNQQYPKAD